MRSRTTVLLLAAIWVGSFLPAQASDDFEVPADVLALEGDPDYGEYLSGECTTCHQADGDNDGIPAIVGWDRDSFVVAMHAYRAKHRDHLVMSMIAARLSDEEIAGLAAYFEALGE